MFVIFKYKDLFEFKSKAIKISDLGIGNMEIFDRLGFGYWE